MDAFYITVIIIAIVFLVLILTLVGTLMTTNNKAVFPPVAEPCPDYWDIISTNTNGSVCKSKGINVGSTSNLFSSKIPGMDGSNKQIDFSDPGWSGPNGSLCEKNTWAKQNSIIWGGVSNYNGCTMKK